MKEFKAALELNPGNAAYYLSLGRLLGQNGRADEALPYFERANKLAPDMPDTWNDRGYTHLQLAQVEEALVVLDEGLRRFPSHGLMHYNRAMALLKLRRTREAVQAYETAVKCGYRRTPVFERLKQRLNK